MSSSVASLPLARLLATGSLVVGASSLAACSGAEGESCGVATDQISAVALVIDTGTEVRAVIDFEEGDRRGSGVPLSLCGSDVLTINGNEPREIEKASRVEYSLTIDDEDALADLDRSFSFVLEREESSERIVFAVELPPSFTIDNPMPGDTIDVGQEVVVQWSDAIEGGTMLVGLGEELGAGQCLVVAPEDQEAGHTYEQRGGAPVPDTGQWTIDAGVLRSESTEPCALTYALTRLQRGQYPTGLQRGGRVEARVERTLDIIFQP